METKKVLLVTDQLAIDRTNLANLRTLLAFIRTGLYFIISALAIFKFGDTSWLSTFAWIFVSIGIIFIIIGIFNFIKTKKSIQRISSS